MPQVETPVRPRQVPQPGTQLGIGENWVLEAHLQENGNMFALIMTPYAPQPFVSCLIVDERKGLWQSGHYFANVNEALADYLERT